MKRYMVTIEYDGTRYNGWQIQKGITKTIQAEVQDACKIAFGTDEKILVQGAGRTDKGVHALCQVVHFDADTDLTPQNMMYRMNDNLPVDITVVSVAGVDNNFHARHDAVYRSYVYHISTRPNAFAKRFVYWVKDRLDVAQMHEAALKLKGLHDFSNFTDEEGDHTSTKVEIKHIAVEKHGSIITIHIIGSHFLWKQVRRMTGILLEAGRGKLSPKEVEAMLTVKTDLPAQKTVPPSGLFLERVYYKGETIDTTAKPLFNLR
jgi:tRNA pseudouridine38-40 synthase